VIVPRLPSFKLSDLAEAMAPGWPHKVNGHRAGDKKHESMISLLEAQYFRSYKDRFVRFQNGDARGEPLPQGFHFSSDNNEHWLTVDGLRTALQWI